MSIYCKIYFKESLYLLRKICVFKQAIIQNLQEHYFNVAPR